MVKKWYHISYKVIILYGGKQMKKRLKGLVALMMVMSMTVTIAPYAKGSISSDRWEALPFADKFIKVVINSEETLEEKLERAYEETGEKLLAPSDIEAHYYPYVGDSMDSYSQYAPKHYTIDSWTIWECDELGGISDGMTKIEVGADYVVDEEHIKQYGQEIDSYIYQPYIEANIIPKEYSFAVLDETGSPIRDDSFNIKNYKEKTLDIPEGYAGYMVTIHRVYQTNEYNYVMFAASYETMLNELNYYIDNFTSADVSISKAVLTKKMPYYVENENKNNIIWLEPEESLTDNEELMSYYPHHMPEGSWQVWRVDGSGTFYEYTKDSENVVLEEAFTSVDYDAFSTCHLENTYQAFKNLYPILKENLVPRIYEIPVYDVKNEKTNETFSISLDNYKVWDDNIDEDSNSVKTYDFNNHMETEGDSWIFEYGDVSVTVDNPEDIGEILFEEKTTCDMAKAKLKAVCIDHKYDAGVVIEDSTLSKLGTTRYTCTKCGDSYTKDDIPKKIAVRTVTLDKTNYVYTGSAIKPIITVKAGNTVLKAGTDYTVSYSNNVKTGKAKLTVKGIGKYAGTKTATFNIIPKKVSGFRQTSYAVNNVPLKWNATAGADGYAVVRKDATTGKLEFVGITKETTYKVTGLKSGSTYQYGVRAYKIIDGNKVFGEVSVIRTTITRTLAPKLKVSPWTKRATVFVDKVRGADGYEICMCTKKYGKYTKIATLTGSSVQYRKNGLLSDKKYYFKVRSYKINAGGAKVYSAFSSIVAGTTR